MNKKRISTNLALVAALMVGGGCAKQARIETAESAASKPATRDSSESRAKTASKGPASEDILDPSVLGTFGPIYFDFDSSRLSAENLRELDRLAGTLDANQRVLLTISGHADERGTDEYNLALGEHRALAAREYLVRSGIEEHRIRTVSYGEEMPAVDAPGEEAWSKNRRAEFELRVAKAGATAVSSL